MNPVNGDSENLISNNNLIKSEETVFLLFCESFSVDELFKEANVGSDGRVYYEEFTRMVTLPAVDY